MSKAHDPSDFAHGSLTPIILHQAVPVMLAQIAQMLYNIVDRIYIGHMPGTGEAALSGVGLVFPIITIIAAIAMTKATTSAIPVMETSCRRRVRRRATSGSRTLQRGLYAHRTANGSSTHCYSAITPLRPLTAGKRHQGANATATRTEPMRHPSRRRRRYKARDGAV